MKRSMVRSALRALLPAGVLVLAGAQAWAAAPTVCRDLARKYFKDGDGSDLANLCAMAAGPVALDRYRLAVVLDGDQHALEEHAHDRLSVFRRRCRCSP